MIRQARKKPPTFCPSRSRAAQEQLRQCEICGKAQTLAEGFVIRAMLCRQCAEGFSEPISLPG